jgi:subtilisin family serine protease
MNKIISNSFLLSLFSLILACDHQDLPETPVQDIAKYSIEYIDGQYVVVLEDRFINFRKSDVFEEQQEAFKKEIVPILKQYKIVDEQIDQFYSTALNGFSARLDLAQLKQLEKDPRVRYIEQDQAVLLRTSQGRGKVEVESTQVVPQGISRVRGGETYRGGNNAFVLDTGIDIEHPDLNVHPVFGFSAFRKVKGSNPANREFYNDGHGHGTHVAGIIGAIDNRIGVVGVAAGATVVPVKVMNDGGWGFMSGIIAGVDYVGHRAKKGDVANMSIGTFPSRALDEAVINAANRRGIWFVAAAGNSGLPARSLSPARITGERYVITVAAMDHRDKFAPWSHYGNPPVDYAAPGVGVFSTWRNGTYRWDSGTSMAAPHIAGLLLYGEIDTDGFAIDPPDDSLYPIGVRKF